jgi:hypothetical protein
VARFATLSNAVFIQNGVLLACTCTLKSFNSPAFMSLSMRCPFCSENIRAGASVCRHCGNDLKIPDALLVENAELDERVKALRRELTELQGRLTRRKKSR